MLHRYTGLKDIYCCFSQAPPLTIIVGAKCSDGSALIADRKLTNIFDESVRYDNKLFGDLSHITMGYTGAEKIFDIFRKYVVGEVIINRDNEIISS
jgi:20S proteasome alpha/beta subunit